MPWSKTCPRPSHWVLHCRGTLGITSLLELSEQQWRAAAATRPNQSLIFLLDARYAIEALRDGTGWETEYGRDVWRLDRLPGIAGPGGRPCPRVRLRFDRITHPRLRDLGKRWTRLRLTSGLSIGAARAGVDALTRFSDFLALAGIDSLADIDRPLLERYLAHAMSQPGGNDVKRHRISSLNVFFQAVRQHGWDDSLPGRATFYPGDTPPIRAQVDRRLVEFVMAQVESPANLDRWSDLSAKLVTVILTRCGLRVSSALSLAFDCVVHDGQGASYLRYFNTKMKREAAVPIDEELEAGIGEQQRAVLRRWPDGPSLLFPRERSNVSGNVPLDPGTYRRKLNCWLQACDIRDEHGRPVHLTPHQWRHTFACRLINRDVPQEVVRVLLDHESHRMTSHYAKLTDQTVRRHWQEATKVNIKGERVSLDPDGPLAQAQWAKTRYGMATQTLITAARRRAAATRKRAVTALRQMDTTGTPITVDAVAKQARVSRSWLYSQPDLRAEIERLRGRRQTAAAGRAVPDRQRASDASLLRRLESATERIKHLETENRQLRDALALALGEQRAATVIGNTRDTPRKKSAHIIGPC